MHIAYFFLLLACSLGFVASDSFEECMRRGAIYRSTYVGKPVCGWSYYEKKFETFVSVTELINAVRCGKDFQYVRAGFCGAHYLSESPREIVLPDGYNEGFVHDAGARSRRIGR